MHVEGAAPLQPPKRFESAQRERGAPKGILAVVHADAQPSDPFGAALALSIMRLQRFQQVGSPP